MAPHAKQPLTGWSTGGKLGTAALPQPPQCDANPRKNGMGTRGSHGHLGLSLVCDFCNFLHSVLVFSCNLFLMMVTCSPVGTLPCFPCFLAVQVTAEQSQQEGDVTSARNKLPLFPNKSLAR